MPGNQIARVQRRGNHHVANVWVLVANLVVFGDLAGRSFRLSSGSNRLLVEDKFFSFVWHGLEVDLFNIELLLGHSCVVESALR